MEGFDEYATLWDGSHPEWCLFRLGDLPDVQERYVIVNKTDRQALIIEDDREHDRVVRRMLAEGVSVLSDFDTWTQE